MLVKLYRLSGTFGFSFYCRRISMLNCFRDMHRWGSGRNPAGFGWARPFLECGGLSYCSNLHSQIIFPPRIVNTSRIMTSYSSLLVNPIILPSYLPVNRFSFHFPKQTLQLLPSYVFIHADAAQQLSNIKPLQNLNRQSIAGYHTTQTLKNDISQQYFAQEWNVSSGIQTDLKETSLPQHHINVTDCIESTEMPRSKKRRKTAAPAEDNPCKKQPKHDTKIETTTEDSSCTNLPKQDTEDETVSFVSQLEKDTNETVSFVNQLEEDTNETVSFVNQLKEDTNETVSFVNQLEEDTSTDSSEDLISEHLIREGQELFQKVCSLRQWEFTDFGLEHLKNPQPGVEFSVMSYNVLAQSLLRDNYYLYNHCSFDILPWKYRQLNLLHEIKVLDADVLCLQEVEEEHYHNFFKIELGKLGYDGIYKKRTGDKRDGCATFYRVEKFSLDTYHTVEYFKPGIKILDRDNIGIIVLLTPKDSHSKRKVCVANTHLLYNPRRGDIKLAQVSLLLAEIDRIACSTKGGVKLKYHPIILCGDFNCEPFCELYNFLGKGKLKYFGLVAGALSGQEDGLRGSIKIMSKELLPISLGISEHCRFFNEQKSVLPNESVSNNSIVTSLEGDSFSEEAKESSTSLNDLASSSGRVIHKLKLVSVYKHFLQRASGEEEVTTYHSKSDATVDYIFYSVKKKKSKIKNKKLNNDYVKEGRLHLLARYGLLSSNELENLGGLPNAGLSSDHLSIMSKFLLS